MGFPCYEFFDGSENLVPKYNLMHIYHIYVTLHCIILEKSPIANFTNKLQVIHLYSPAWCFVLMWLLRVFCSERLVWHILQTYLLIFLWMLFSWVLLLDFWEILCSQNSHLYVSTFVWWHFKCNDIENTEAAVRSFWQILQHIEFSL